LDPRLSDSQRRLLTTVFERGAESASQALTTWLGHSVRLSVSAVEDVTFEEGVALLGPGDQLVACCSLGLSGRLTGQLLLVFEDSAGLALADLLLKQPVGTSVAWGELERSAATETANIVGCAYLNSLAMHLVLPNDPASQPADVTLLVPSPPSFRHEFAGSLLQFVLMDQAAHADRLVLLRSQFSTEQMELHWLLLFVPSCRSLATFALS
jgi:chemotaxis protein CheC